MDNAQIAELLAHIKTIADCLEVIARDFAEVGCTISENTEAIRDAYKEKHGIQPTSKDSKDRS